MLQTLSLFDFRNYDEKHLEFSEKNVVFFGENGRGKTNILEAISILSVGKSWRETSPSDLILENIKPRISINSEKIDFQTRVPMNSQNLEPGLEENSKFQNLGNTLSAKISATLAEDSYDILIEPRSRTFLKNNKRIALRRHFGRIPTLLFVPEHLGLFSGTKRSRQSFFDRFLFQISETYREDLSIINKTIKQKNALLKDLANFGGDRSSVNMWNRILAKHIPNVISARKTFLKELKPLLNAELRKISGTNEPIDIYLQITEDFVPTEQGVLDWFETNAERELAAQRNLISPTRDDFAFFLREKPILSTASRGEERSVLLALLAAKKHFLKEKYGRNPILLLDDVFSELDSHRQTALENICEDGQIFFTTTHFSHFEKFANPVQKFEIV